MLAIAPLARHIPLVSLVVAGMAGCANKCDQVFTEMMDRTGVCVAEELFGVPPADTTETDDWVTYKGRDCSADVRNALECQASCVQAAPCDAIAGTADPESPQAMAYQRCFEACPSVPGQ